MVPIGSVGNIASCYVCH